MIQPVPLRFPLVDDDGLATPEWSRWLGAAQTALQGEWGRQGFFELRGSILAFNYLGDGGVSLALPQRCQLASFPVLTENTITSEVAVCNGTELVIPAVAGARVSGVLLMERS